MSIYRVVLVDQGGRPITELVRAKVDHITWELNAPGEAVYVVPVLDSQATDAAVMLQREVQIWRDGALIFWGIPIFWRGSGSSMVITAFGLLYYFATRYFGPVYSNAMTPMIVNGNFELGASGWSSSTNIANQSTAVNAAIDASHHYTGTRSIKLTGTGDTQNPSYIYQVINTPTPARSQPLTLTLSAWGYPQGITTYGLQDRGIMVQINDGGPLQAAGSWAQLNANVPDRRWSRFEIQVVMPAAHAYTVSVALFAPAVGAVNWDQVRFTYEQKTGAIEGEDWVDDYLRRVFNYGAGNTGGGARGPGGSLTSQDAWWGAPVLKSNLGMNFYSAGLAAGAVPVDTFWSHEDNGEIYEAMTEVFKRDKADFEITWNAAGTTRGLTPYVPRKGSVKPALAFELGRNITKFDYDVDGRQSANDVRVVGRNSGNTKEVGQAGGPTPSTIGGVQFEKVLTPPQEVDGQGLIDTAVTSERQLHAPVVLPTLTVKAAGLLDTTNVGGPLRVGDTVPVRMNHGAIQENDLRRVVKMTLRPAAEEIDAVVNVVA